MSGLSSQIIRQFSLASPPDALAASTTLMLLCLTIGLAHFRRRARHKELDAADLREDDEDDEPTSEPEPESPAGEVDDFSDVVKRQLQEWALRVRAPASNDEHARRTDGVRGSAGGVKGRLRALRRHMPLQLQCVVKNRLPLASSCTSSRTQAQQNVQGRDSERASAHEPERPLLHGSVVMKNWVKWHAVTPMCVELLGRLVTMKMPCNAEGTNHTVRAGDRLGFERCLNRHARGLKHTNEQGLPHATAGQTARREDRHCVEPAAHMMRTKRVSLHTRPWFKHRSVLGRHLSCRPPWFPNPTCRLHVCSSVSLQPR